MSSVPANPKVYHITHVENLARIVEWGLLLSDARRLATGLDCRVVGMANIKQRRLDALKVHCHPGTKVGDYVPFYFCPRSVMLYLLFKGNHPDLDYHGGQGPIVHLEADLRRAAQWADAEGRAWTFTDCNAGATYARFFTDLSDLGEVNWPAVDATDWREPSIQEGKQAEFLVHESFPWSLVDRIGVLNQSVRDQAAEAIRNTEHKPLVSIEPGWYY